MGKLREPLKDLASCGLPSALEVMGERWSFMILRAAFNGVRHFEEFLDQLGMVMASLLGAALAPLHARRRARSEHALLAALRHAPKLRRASGVS